MASLFGGVMSKKEIENNLKEEYSYNTFLEEYINQYIAQVDLNTGFSLDPDIKIAEFLSTLERIAIKKDTAYLRNWYNTYIKPDLLNAFKFEQKSMDEMLKEGAAFKSKDNHSNEIEISLYTLIHGNSSRGEDHNSRLDSLWRNLFSYSDDEVNEVLAESYKMYSAAIENNRYVFPFLMGKSHDASLDMYYELRRLLNNQLTIEVSKSTPNLDLGSRQNFEDVLNRKIVKDVQLGLRELNFYNELRVVSFTDSLEKSIIALQEYAGLNPTGIIDDITYATIIANSSVKEENEYLAEFLEILYRTNSYQKARYDGMLQNTEIGMTLFYTDLLMKLWSFDYKDSAPEEYIEGFVSEAHYPISLTYYDNIQNYPSTRSWLGDQEAGYNFHNRNKTVLFAHCATKIYNASSNDLFPGEEVESNYPSKRFANWWNNHYLQVADYEQEYHKLNQIMKWSVLITWLKSNGKCTFLDQQTSKKTKAGFDKWYIEHKDNLTCHISIPFLDSTKLEQNTECMDLLKSEPFYLFANEYYTYSLSGGVSLPSAQKIQQRLSSSLTAEKTLYPVKKIIKQKKIPNTTTKSVLDYSINEEGRINREVNLWAKNTEIEDIYRYDKSFSKTGDELIITETTNSGELGSFKIKNNEISYDDGSVLTAKKVIDEINNSQYPDAILYDSRRIENIIDFGENKCLAKLKNSEEWLLINKDVTYKEKGLFKTSSGKGKYYTASLVNNSEVSREMSGLNAYSIRKSNFGNIEVEATNLELNEGNLFNLQVGDRTYNIAIKKDYLDETIIELQSCNVLDRDIQNIEFLKKIEKDQDGLSGLLTRTEEDANSFYLMKDSDNGLVVTLSKKKISNSLVERYTAELGLNTEAEGAYFISKSNTGVKVTGSADKPIIHIQEVPSFELTTVAKETNSMVTDESTFYAMKELNEVTKADIDFFKTISEDNSRLKKFYAQFKEQVKELPEGYVVCDFNTEGRFPQVLVLTKAGEPRVINIEKIAKRNCVETANELKKVLNSKEIVTIEEYNELTSDVASILEEVITKTNAKKLITIEPEGLNLSAIKQTHEIKPEVSLEKDQPDIQRSILNAIDTAYLNFYNLKYLTTVSLSHPEFPYIDSINTCIINTGIEIDTTLTSFDFYSPDDLFMEQNLMVVRCNETGIVLKDQLITYEDLEYSLKGMETEKGFIYIVSNQCDSIKRIFSESGKFSSVYTSSFEFGDYESFSFTFENMSTIFSTHINEVVTIKSKQLRSIKKNDPYVYNILKNCSKKSGRNRLIHINKTSANEKKQIKQKALSSLKDDVKISIDPIDELIKKNNVAISNYEYKAKNYGNVVRALIEIKH